ncbi:uncharacterized protein LOC130902106 [Diorhabda carinulata]|uniref:uncharacterized protein LOC130902106 n=1 Tax=Diorhabda carinulata TaxID=1163345 RepID=UPI0025A13C62|nr:uncharacterized protein LOC130902106 [Diorhabda carinulata]
MDTNSLSNLKNASKPFVSIQSNINVTGNHKSSFNEIVTSETNQELRLESSQIYPPNQDFNSNKEEIGRELKENNEKIVEYIVCLRQHREELTYIIDKQYKERKKLETEMERVTYKLCLINKSMAQRIKTKKLYDDTIAEIESNYCHLIKDSEKILGVIRSEYEKLESTLNKKTSTEETDLTDENASGEHVGKAFKCPKLISTLDKIGTKYSNPSNDTFK